MKRTLALSALLLSGIMSASAQTHSLFLTSESIDTGNIKAGHLVHGDMWWDPASGDPACEYPKGSGKTISFVSALWMSGYDAQNNLHVAAQTYRAKGTDYWPGPIDTPNAQVSYVTSRDWSKIWKVTRQQVESFWALPTRTVSNIPTPILEWPAMGNPFARGNGGVALTISRAMAPFMDVNNDGRYNPLQGDYPKIKGDQMLWWIINDAGPTSRSVSGTSSFPVEIQIHAYAYARNTNISDVIFYEYHIKNRGSLTYQNFRAGLFADIDVRYGFDDHANFDSGRRIGYNFGSGAVDFDPPASGVAIMEQPGDAYQSYQPAGSFVIVRNGATGPDTDPKDGLEMYRTMNSYNRAGMPLPNNAKYQSTDSICFKGLAPNDQRFVLASKDMVLDTGATVKLGMALVVTANAGICPTFSDSALKATVDSAYKYYWNPPALQHPTSVGNYGPLHALRLYPNPAGNTLYLDVADLPKGVVSIYNAIGQECTPMVDYGSQRIAVHTLGLIPGVYTIRYKTSMGNHTGIFVRE